MVCALTIAGSDSSSGAGVQTDLAVFRDLGLHGLCVITNVTAQNSREVRRIAKVAPSTIAAQIDAVTRDFEIGACKIGMLYSPRVVDLVAERIDRRGLTNVVLDPVMQAKHGQQLLTPPAVKRMRRWLIPKVTLITPNAAEAAVLTGVEVADAASAAEAAKVLVEMGAGSALVKGGHIEGDAVDVLFDGSDVHEFRSERFEKNMHGTGCVLSSAIAAYLAQGKDLREAVGSAKDYVSQAIAHSVRMGKGNLDYFAPFRRA